MVGDEIELGKLGGRRWDPIMEGPQGPVEEFGLDPRGNRESLHVTGRGQRHEARDVSKRMNLAEVYKTD